MKKFLVLVIALLALVCVPAIAQEVINPENPPEVGWGFDTFTALTALTALAISFVVEICKRGFPNLPSFIKQIVSWLIGIAVALVGWWLELGFLSGLNWYIVLAYGFGAGLIANGVFDTGIVTWIFGLLGMKEK